MSVESKDIIVKKGGYGIGAPGGHDFGLFPGGNPIGPGRFPGIPGFKVVQKKASGKGLPGGVRLPSTPKAKGGAKTL